MEENFAVIENYLMVKMPREVDHHESKTLSKKADEYILGNRIKNVVFDFEDTKFMDSEGIGVIIGRYKKIECFGGKVIAVNCSRQIKRILDMSGLYKYIEVME